MIPNYVLGRETSIQKRVAWFDDLAFIREGYVFAPTNGLGKEIPWRPVPFALVLAYATISQTTRNPELWRVAWVDLRWPADGTQATRDINAYPPASFVCGTHPQKPQEWLGAMSKVNPHSLVRHTARIKQERDRAESDARYFQFELGEPMHWNHVPVFGWSEWK